MINLVIFIVIAVIVYFLMIAFLPIRAALIIQHAVASDWAVVIIGACVIYLLVQL
jgi:hypothetical protein